MNFGKRLKGLREKRKITQQMLAEELDLGRTTISNYEKELRHPDHQTLIKIATYFQVSLDYLLGISNISSIRSNDEINNEPENNNKNNLRDKICQDFSEFLLNKDFKNAYNVIVNQRDNISLLEIYEHVITPCLHKMDSLCLQNKINKAQRDFFVTSIERIISQICPSYDNHITTDYTALTTTILGEFHSFAIQMISNLLDNRGWKVIYLGKSSPSQSIIKTIIDYQPELLVLSTTMYYNVEKVENLIQTIRSKDNIKIPKIIVGGFAFDHNQDLWQEVNADAYASNFKQLLRTGYLPDFVEKNQ